MSEVPLYTRWPRTRQPSRRSSKTHTLTDTHTHTLTHSHTHTHTLTHSHTHTLTHSHTHFLHQVAKDEAAIAALEEEVARLTQDLQALQPVLPSPKLLVFFFFITLKSRVE